MCQHEECYACEEKQEKLDEAKEFLEAIVEQLYSEESLNTSLLEFRLDELCHYLDVKIIPKDLQIERKKEKDGNKWIVLHNNFLSQHAQ